jgi:hypothetical protein
MENRLAAFWRDESPKERDHRLNSEARVLMRMGYKKHELRRLSFHDQDGVEKEMIVPASVVPDE